MVGTLWMSVVPGRPWAAHNQPDSKGRRLPTPSDETLQAVLDATRRVQAHATAAPPKPPSPRRHLPLGEPSPRAKRGMLLAAQRSAQTVAASAPTSSRTDHPTWGRPHRSVGKVARPKAAVAKLRKLGKPPEWTWITLPDVRSPSMSQHSLTALGFGSMRYLVAYGGLDASGRPTGSVWTLSIPTIPNVFQAGTQTALADPRQPTYDPSISSPVKPFTLLEGAGDRSKSAPEQPAEDHVVLTWTEERHLGVGDGGRGEPYARFAHASCEWGCNRKVVHGGVGGAPGRPLKLLSDTQVLLCVRENGNVESCTWEWHKIDVNGEIPSARRSHAIAASDSNMLFLYGGEITSSRVAKCDVDDQRESFGAEAEEYEESSTRELLTVCSDMFVLADLDAGRLASGMERRRLPTGKARATRLIWSKLKTNGSLPPGMYGHSLLSAGAKTLILTGGRDKKRALIPSYSLGTFIFDVDNFSWTLLNGHSVPSQPWLPRIVFNGDQKAEADVGRVDNDRPTLREKPGCATLALQTQGSVCMFVYGGLSPVEGGGRRLVSSSVDTFHASSAKWIDSQFELHGCPNALTARWSHPCIALSSCAVYVFGGKFVDSEVPQQPATSGHGMVITQSTNVQRLSPRRIEVAGGTPVYIYGRHFEDTGQILVRFTAMLQTEYEKAAERAALTEADLYDRKMQCPPPKKDVYNEDNDDKQDSAEASPTVQHRGSFTAKRLSIFAQANVLDRLQSSQTPSPGGRMKSRRLTGTATSMLGLLGGAQHDAPDGWTFHAKHIIVPGTFVDSETLTVESPDLRDVFVEGPITVDVSLDEAPPGKDRLWTNDHVEATALASISPTFTRWFGSGLTGGAAGEWCQLTALTMDMLRRPKRLGGIKMDLELVWFRPTAEEEAQSTAEEVDLHTDTTEEKAVEEIVVRRASLSNHQQQQEAAASAAAAFARLEAEKQRRKKKPSKTIDLLQPVDHLSLDSQAKKAEPQKHAPAPSQSQNINAAQPLRGSFRLRRRSLAGDEAAAAELAASISVLAHSKPLENSAAASDPEHLREAKDQHDGTYVFNYRETQAGYYRAIVLCAGRAIRHFIVLVEPGRLDPEKCFVGGPCFEKHDPGHHALQIELYDKHGNAAPWPTNPGVKVVVTWESNQGVAGVAEKQSDATRQVDPSPPTRKFGWKKAGQRVPVAEFELTEPPEEGDSLRVPMLRSGRYFISVTYQGQLLGDNTDKSITGQPGKKSQAVPRETYISAAESFRRGRRHEPTIAETSECRPSEVGSSSYLIAGIALGGAPPLV